MIIYALSATEHAEYGGLTIPSSHTSEAPNDTQTIRVQESYSMNWLANDIKNRVDIFREETGRTDTKIWVLRIHSHGNAGMMTIGQNLDIHSAGEFSVLRENYFSPSGLGIQLWGCAVASAYVFGVDQSYDVDIDGDGINDAWSETHRIALQEYRVSLDQVTDHPTLRRGSSYPSNMRGTTHTFIPGRVEHGRIIYTSVEDGRGYRMMHELAEASQIKVTAAFDIQIPEFSGDEWQWEGTGLLEVQPNGDYRIIPLGDLAE